MVLSSLDGAEDDESRVLGHSWMLWNWKRIDAKPGRKRGRPLKPFCGSKCAQLVLGRLAVCDDSGRGGKHRPHSRAMTTGLAGPAKLRMGDGDEIVDEIDRLHIRSRNPIAESR